MRAYVDIDGVKHAIRNIYWEVGKISTVCLYIDGFFEIIFNREGLDSMEKYSFDDGAYCFYLDLNKHVYWEKTKNEQR